MSIKLLKSQDFFYVNIGCLYLLAFTARGTYGGNEFVQETARWERMCNVPPNFEKETWRASKLEYMMRTGRRVEKDVLVLEQAICRAFAQGKQVDNVHPSGSPCDVSDRPMTPKSDMNFWRVHKAKEAVAPYPGPYPGPTRPHPGYSDNHWPAGVPKFGTEPHEAVASYYGGGGLTQGMHQAIDQNQGDCSAGS